MCYESMDFQNRARHCPLVMLESYRIHGHSLPSLGVWWNLRPVCFSQQVDRNRFPRKTFLAIAE